MKHFKKLISTVIKIFVIFAGLAGPIFGGLLYFSDSLLTLQSLESKTIEGKPVFNQIRWIQEKDRDIWMMNQSHHGPHAPSEKWDRLAIVIDKTSNPKTATYLQLPAGTLEWKDELPQQKLPFRVSCFMCHTNGPRALRPDPSGQLQLSPFQKIKLIAWNLRIKTYGRIQENPDHKLTDRTLKIPFRQRHAFDNEPLKIKVCQKCHNEKFWWARGSLTRQNSMTIGFIVENGLMPPPGFVLSAQEEKKLKDFLQGF